MDKSPARWRSQRAASKQADISVHRLPGTGEGPVHLLESMFHHEDFDHLLDAGLQVAAAGLLSFNVELQ